MCNTSRFHLATSILENVPVAERTYRIRLTAPGIVEHVRPGQFVMLRLAEGDDPLLGRPFGVYRTCPDGTLDLVYLVVGKMTGRLATLPAGTPLTVWGPLGNGWDTTEAERERYDHFLLVGGGIGHTPLYQVAGHFVRSTQPPRMTLLYGAQTTVRIACMDDFRALGIDVRIATDDGSAGVHGYVSDLIAEAATGEPQRTKILACGPPAMLRAVAAEAERLGLACDVSLETNMSCGLGLCFGCVIPYREDPESDDWDYRRTCTDGPVFDARKLKWET